MGRRDNHINLDHQAAKLEGSNLRCYLNIRKDDDEHNQQSSEQQSKNGEETAPSSALTCLSRVFSNELVALQHIAIEQNIADTFRLKYLTRVRLKLVGTSLNSSGGLVHKQIESIRLFPINNEVVQDSNSVIEAMRGTLTCNSS